MGSYCLMGTVSVWNDENILEMDGGNGCKTTWMHLMPLECILQFSSVPQLCPTLCDPMKRSTPGLPVHHQLPELTQTHVYWVGDAIQPSHPLSFPFPPAPNPSQHQSLFQRVRGERFSSACLLCSSQPSAENRAARTAHCERSAAGVVTCTPEQGALLFQSSFWLSTGDSVKTGKCGITWLGGGLG